jgi:ectoine hydroxylase-related dioxygenase (phytanoyl-CoA dioxygenase family)
MTRGLNAETAAELKELGYSVAESVLSAGECERLLDALSAPDLKRSRAGARHLMSHRSVATLANDARLLELARLALGPGATPSRATLFEKSAQSNWLVVWHQDTALPLGSRFDAPGWGPWSEKAGIKYAHAPGWALARIVALRVHLDPSNTENGPLRVVPGSHHAGLLTDEEVFAHTSAHEQIECLAGCGGVLLMRPLLIHSSSKAAGPGPRRVLHLEYADSLELAPGIRLAVA